MTQPQVLHLESLDALREHAAAWDDLWQRSCATQPALRAGLLAHWVERFAEPDQFWAVVIEAKGRWLAALPMVQRRVRRILTAGAMPSNEWATCGDLLLDESGDVAETLAALRAGFCATPWPLLWLDLAELDAPRWRQLKQSCAEGGMTVAEHACWQVGRVMIDHDWPAYQSRWSKKRRQRINSAARSLAQQGAVRLDLRSQFSPDQVAETMQQCFELEDKSWKGEAGTSVLRSPGMRSFYTEQAQKAAEVGNLEVALLYCGETLAAFSYGLSAKGVFHSTKVSYDPAFADQQPGQLLRYYLLERMFADPQRRALDFLGIMTEAHRAWLPELYTIGRLAIAPNSWRGRLVVKAYQQVWPAIRNWRRGRTG